MKLKFTLFGICVLSILAIAAPHSWILKTGKTFDGEFVSSGTAVVVVRRDGTNYFLKISDLATNELSYLATMQVAQRQARLDLESKQMLQAGMAEFTADLIEHFPEKVRSKNGWMDAEFIDFNTTGGRSPERDLGFYVKDSQGKTFSSCCVSRLFYGQGFINDPSLIRPNPFIDVISKLKKGDKVRFVGNVDDPRTTGFGDGFVTYHFFVDRIEMIESAAEKKAREDSADYKSDATR